MPQPLQQHAKTLKEKVATATESQHHPPPTAMSTPSAPLQHEPLYVSWSRSQQRRQRQRDALLHGLHAQADPSEAAGIAGPITSWAEQHAREKRLHASAIAGLQGRSLGQAG